MVFREELPLLGAARGAGCEASMTGRRFGRSKTASRHASQDHGDNFRDNRHENLPMILYRLTAAYHQADTRNSHSNQKGDAARFGNGGRDIEIELSLPGVGSSGVIEESLGDVNKVAVVVEIC